MPPRPLPRPTRRARAAAVALLSALPLAACGFSTGSDGPAIQVY